MDTSGTLWVKKNLYSRPSQVLMRFMMSIAFVQYSSIVQYMHVMYICYSTEDICGALEMQYIK